MRTFSVSSIYSIDNVAIQSGSNAVHVTFDIQFPDGIRNSKKALKNLFKSSPELRDIIAQEIVNYITINQIEYHRTRTYAYCSVLGNSCDVNMYFGQDFANQPRVAYITEILRKISSS